MKKSAFFALALLLAIPTATAEDRVLTVTDNGKYDQTFYNQLASSTYSFSLNQLFFNTTNFTVNESVWHANIYAQIIESGSISESKKYDFTFYFNNTWQINYQIQLTKHSFGFWSRDYYFTLTENGITIASCETTEGILKPFYGGTMGAPQPWIKFEYLLHGRYGTNPSLYVSFGSFIQGDTTCNLPTSVGGGIQIVMTELTETPSVQLTTYDAKLYTHKLGYSFDTKQHEQEAQAEFNANNAQGCRQTFIIFGLCNLIDGLKAFIEWVFGGIEYVATAFLGRIPYVGVIFQFIGIAINVAGDLIVNLLDIFFVTEDEFGIGEVFWFHLVYFTAWGCIFAAFTGKLWLIVTIPIWFVYYTGMVLYYFFKFWFWTLPKFAIETVRGLAA